MGLASAQRLEVFSGTGGGGGGVRWMDSLQNYYLCCHPPVAMTTLLGD